MHIFFMVIILLNGHPVGQPIVMNTTDPACVAQFIATQAENEYIKQTTDKDIKYQGYCIKTDAEVGDPL